MKTYGSFFSGGGIADIGFRAAGYELVFANEYEKPIADVYALNLGNHIRVADIRDEDVRRYPWVNHFHASPVCTRASVANKNRGEADIDIETARKVSEYIAHHKPDTVTIENVSAYRHFESYKGIIQTLDDNGYWHNASILNSADFGVPQTRRRLIVRAVRGGFVPPLPAPVEWIGWYAAVEDIIDTFEPSEFAEWQLERLPRMYKTFMMEPTEMRHASLRDFDKPSQTIKANRHTNFRAFIVDGQPCDNGQVLTIRNQEAPIYTVTASADRKPARAWLSAGRVVKISPRGLARFQSIPDWYQLPDNKALACKIIGNGWPSLMAQKIAETLINA